MFVYPRTCSVKWNPSEYFFHEVVEGLDNPCTIMDYLNDAENSFANCRSLDSDIWVHQVE